MRTFFTLLLSLILTQGQAQKFPSLEKVLSKELSENSTTDGRWVFYPEKGNIEYVAMPLVSAQVPNYRFYKVQLTNYLGYHVNEATCVVLYDSVKSKFILVEPLWYGDIPEALVKLFIGKKFKSKDDLLAFFNELNELMQTGSGYKFINPVFTDTQLTYVLGSFKGDSITTGGNGTSSTVKYNEDGVWRNIVIDLKDLCIKRYTSINPVTKEKQVVK